MRTRKKSNFHRKQAQKKTQGLSQIIALIASKLSSPIDYKHIESEASKALIGAMEKFLMKEQIHFPQRDPVVQRSFP